ncbi:hypothetical protein XENOCAPTIV_018946 [Xenoophorus captivus]|uniref:Uncharacterized protein n=1 Tax=Xenoophorus captivus TaxID=1517983 RepID=A0ABV0RBE7_9TELE
MLVLISERGKENGMKSTSKNHFYRCPSAVVPLPRGNDHMMVREKPKNQISQEHYTKSDECSVAYNAKQPPKTINSTESDRVVKFGSDPGGKVFLLGLLFLSY